MESESNIKKMTVLKHKHKQPYLSPNNYIMRNKKKQSSNQTTTPNAYEQTVMISPETRPCSSGRKWNETSNNEEEYTIPHSSNLSPALKQKQQEIIAHLIANTPNTNPNLLIIEEEVETMNEDSTILSVSSFEFESTDEEQETKDPASRDQEIVNQQKLIQDMEQTIDQNTSMINRLSKKIKIMETKAEDTYNHPDIASKDREVNMKVRDT